MSDDDTAEPHSELSTREFAAGAYTLYHHQVVHATWAATELFPWVPGDYLIVDLDTPLGVPTGGGDPTEMDTGVRFVGLPLGDDSPVSVLPPEHIADALAGGALQPYVHDGVPEWGY